MDSSLFRANTILRYFQQEDAMTRAHATQSGTTATALAAIQRDKPLRICSNCNKEGHLTTYCIKPGGSMARKTLEEAHTAQHNARRSGCNGNTNSQQTSTVSVNMVTTTGTS